MGAIETNIIREGDEATVKTDMYEDEEIVQSYETKIIKMGDNKFKIENEHIPKIAKYDKISWTGKKKGEWTEQAEDIGEVIEGMRQANIDALEGFERAVKRKSTEKVS